MEINAFDLSRIYSEGWNAAQKLLAKRASGVDEPLGAMLNPYKIAPARERWAKGFKEALHSRTGLSNARRINWSRTAEK